MTHEFDPLNDPPLLDYFDPEPFTVNADNAGGQSMPGGVCKRWPEKSLKLGQPSALASMLTAGGPTYAVSTGKAKGNA